MFSLRKTCVISVIFTLCILLIAMSIGYAAVVKAPSKTLKPIPSISVTDPTSNTVWMNHEYHTIAWTSVWVSGNVRVEIWKDGVYYSTLLNSISIGENGAGSFKAYIGSNYYRSGKYQIKVVSLANENVFGISPMFFINEKVF